MGRVSTLLGVFFAVLIAAILVSRGLEIFSPRSMMNSSAEMPLGTRLQRLMQWGRRDDQDSRYIRVTVHTFEAYSTGILPLSLPPLEAAAVTRYGDRIFDMIHEMAQCYDRLVTLYPAAHFDLVSAEEGMMVVKNGWSGSASKPDREGLVFQARDYTIRVNPASLDESNWLTTQITVEHKGRFLLGTRVTSQANGTPSVIGGPIEGDTPDGNLRAVFVGVSATFVPTEVVDQARAKSQFFESSTFDRPPYLIELAEVEKPEILSDDEVEGMSIFLTHIGEDGRVLNTILVSSLQADYDEAALNAIKRSRFAPASQVYKPVDSWMFVPVQFLSDRRTPVVSPAQDETE